MKTFFIMLIICVVEALAIAVVIWVANKYRTERNDARAEVQTLNLRLAGTIDAQNRRAEREKEYSERVEDRNTGDPVADVAASVDQLSELSKKQRPRTGAKG